MDLIELIVSHAEKITVPFLLVIGVIIAYLWKQKEANYKRELKLCEKRIRFKSEQLESVRNSIILPTELQAQLLVMKDIYSDRIELLEKERNSLSNQILTIKNLSTESKKALLEAANKHINREKEMEELMITLIHNISSPLSSTYARLDDLEKLVSDDKKITKKIQGIKKSLFAIKNISAPIFKMYVNLK